MTIDSQTPYAANGLYPDAVGNPSEANQRAHFPDLLRSFPFGGISHSLNIGCWMSTRNEPGPLSETVSATVPG